MPILSRYPVDEPPRPRAVAHQMRRVDRGGIESRGTRPRGCAVDPPRALLILVRVELLVCVPDGTHGR